MRYKSGKRILGTLIAAVCLAGCGAEGGEESIPGAVEMEVPGGEGAGNLDAAELEEPEADSASQTQQQVTGGEAQENDVGLELEVSGETGRIRRITADGEELRNEELPQDSDLTLASEDWGLSFGESGTKPAGNAAVEDLAWYDAYYMDDDSDKVIYLTFDCGYENGNTQPILDALKKHGAPATFFVVGHFLETAPELVKRMVEEGHVVGNHTYHHPDMSAISEKTAFQKELDDVADLFHEITGENLSRFYRPPQGKCNIQNMIMARECGYQTVFWSLAYVDWDMEKQPRHEEAFEKLTSRIHPGAIVLLHNTSQTNGEILDELLAKWEEMGYSFAPLADLEISVDTN